MNAEKRGASTDSVMGGIRRGECAAGGDREAKVSRGRFELTLPLLAVALRVPQAALVAGDPKRSGPMSAWSASRSSVERTGFVR